MADPVALAEMLRVDRDSGHQMTSANVPSSLRKYIEHMGLAGASPLSATRSVHGPGWTAQAVSFSLFHEPYHGVHHKYARLPHGALPQLADELIPVDAEELPPYPNYRQALWDMLHALGDPRVGPQWTTSNIRAGPGTATAATAAESIAPPSPPAT